jgi:endonuclease/exonuclease/phosphatase family metal-dependent hydrolase
MGKTTLLVHLASVCSKDKQGRFDCALARSATGRQTGSMKLRILSLNAGLLKLLGRSVPVPFVEERGAALPVELRKAGCDIVLLQEVYEHSTRRWLAESLQDIYPFAIYPRKKRNFGLENGLMTFSRFPASGDLELFRDASLDEALFDSKGFLMAHHQIAKNVTFNTVNLHTTAGGMFRLPEHQSIDLIRSRQIKQMLNRARNLSPPLVVAGDLNAGPGVSEKNFQQMMMAGFLSIHDLINGPTSEATWDPNNPLNSHGPHKACPPQRIDHFFVKSAELDENRIRAVSSTICLKESVVPISGKEAVTLSDHFGICVQIHLSVDPLPSAGSPTT